VAFGAGGLAPLLIEDSLRNALIASGEAMPVALLFLTGAAAQVLVAFLDKYANWYRYSGEDDPEFRKAGCAGSDPPSPRSSGSTSFSISPLWRAPWRQCGRGSAYSPTDSPSRRKPEQYRQAWARKTPTPGLICIKARNPTMGIVCTPTVQA
jgi:hypothetical protein